jgi:hypothetical protein
LLTKNIRRIQKNAADSVTKLQHSIGKNHAAHQRLEVLLPVRRIPEAGFPKVPVLTRLAENIRFAICETREVLSL